VTRHCHCFFSSLSEARAGLCLSFATQRTSKAARSTHSFLCLSPFYCCIYDVVGSLKERNRLQNERGGTGRRHPRICHENERHRACRIGRQYPPGTSVTRRVSMNILLYVSLLDALVGESKVGIEIESFIESRAVMN